MAEAASCACGPIHEGRASAHLYDLSEAIEEAEALGVATLIVGGPGSAQNEGNWSARTVLSQASRRSTPLFCDPNAEHEYGHFDMTEEEPVGPLLVQALRSSYGCVWPAAELDVPSNQPPYEFDPDNSWYAVRIGGHRFVLSGGVSSECGVGWEQDEEVIRMCPETLEVLSCLPSIFDTWGAACPLPYP